MKISIKGIFDDFKSNPSRQAQTITRGDEGSFVLESIAIDRQSIFHVIKRKKTIVAGDETMLTLDIMYRMQDYIQTSLKQE
jgi:predicted DNA-binding protein YlxM (UPF0122 family)